MVMAPGDLRIARDRRLGLLDGAFDVPCLRQFVAQEKPRRAVLGLPLDPTARQRENLRAFRDRILAMLLL